jgi:crotonobetainyl-CoA:carnitine CoA-transferase CaiB-like acyl-CoA transferase
VDEVFADPQVEALRLTRKVEHATDGELELLRHPVTFSKTPTDIRMPPPMERAHTREILQECGYQAADIAKLIVEQIVAAVRGAAL